MIVDVLKNHQFKYVIIAMESTGFWCPPANYLASDLLAPFSVRVYCLNPKEVKNYKNLSTILGKNDGIDSFVIADFRVLDVSASNHGAVPNTLLYSGLQDIVCTSLNALPEENIYVNNIFLKFSEYALLRDGEHPFQINTMLQPEAILTEFTTNRRYLNSSVESSRCFH